MDDRAVVEEVSADNVRAHVEHIVKEMPGRLAGSENGRRMAEYSAEKLHAAGVDAGVRETIGLVSFPKPGRLEMLSPVAEPVDCFTSAHSVATPPEGVTAELVYLGPGGVDDFRDRDVAGKLVLCENSYSPARMEKQRLAALNGAVGMVVMNWGYPDDTTLPFGSVKPVWGNPTPETLRDEMPRIPAVGVARASGLRLKALCAEGPVRIRIHTDVENAWRPIQITIGTIPAEGSEDFVIVGGHQDSWYGEAATDNATGNACMIELARVFNAHRKHLRRGIEFGFWAAHETGTMVGSSWYADQNWERLRRHAVAYLSIDQPACVGTTSRWVTKSNMEMRRFHQAIEKRFLSVSSDWKPQNKGGDASFFGLGIPMIYGMGAFTEADLQASGHANLGWWHHSIESTIDKVDFGWMASHLRVYAAWLWELCTAMILPYEFTALAGHFRLHLDNLAQDRGLDDLRLSAVAEKARDLESLAARVDDAAQAWRRQYAKGDPDNGRAAALLNACLKKLSNRLIPIQSTVKGVYGHDPYGYTPQLSPIPCLYDTGRYGELAPGTEERAILGTHLTRQRNRVSDALADACDVIEDNLSRLATPPGQGHA
jgi:hypothetical protein